MNRPPVFPFAALVGLEQTKLALLLNAIDPRIGGVLVRGEKGAAKSTAVRGFARLLPEIAVVAGCPFGCEPDGPARCATCQERAAAGETLPVQRRTVRVVDLPVGATEDRVIGTLDLERALQAGERAFEPGLLAAAHRGILYVDEVNLLSDHLVDVLLDAAAMGWNHVEREGVSVAHPAEFILVGTMNPEEGDLRPQLLDRFALAVDVAGPDEPADRAEVVRRRIAFERDPTGFLRKYQEDETAIRERVRRARALLPEVTLDDELLASLTRICAAYGIDGLRGDIVTYKAARALAAYHGRDRVDESDLHTAARLALLHRRRRTPFDPPGSATGALEQAIAQASLPDAGGEPAGSPDAGDGAAREVVFAPGNPAPVRPLPVAPSPRPIARPEAGRRSGALTENRRGRVAGFRTPTGPLTYGDLALDATLRAAAPHQVKRRRTSGPTDDPRLVLVPADLRARVRKAPRGNLIIFLVDASGSMGAQQRMTAVKSAVLGLLQDAYRKRDRVALIAFRGDTAETVLPPTASVERAARALAGLPTGGRTPLAHGLALAGELAAAQRDSRWDPLLVLLSDGRANAGPGREPLGAALAAAQKLAATPVRALVIDTETGPVRLGLSRRIAAALGAPCEALDEFTGAAVTAAVTRRLAGGDGVPRG